MASINKHFIEREKLIMSRVPNSLCPVRNQASQQEVGLRSFICICSSSPVLTLPPELCLLSDQRRHNIHYSLESSWNHHPWYHLWENCLPWNRSLVPKRLGNPTLYYTSEDTVYLIISYNETSSYFGFLNITLNIS